MYYTLAQGRQYFNIILLFSTLTFRQSFQQDKCMDKYLWFILL